MRLLIVLAALALAACGSNENYRALSVACQQGDTQECAVAEMARLEANDQFPGGAALMGY